MGLQGGIAAKLKRFGTYIRALRSPYCCSIGHALDRVARQKQRPDRQKKVRIMSKTCVRVRFLVDSPDPSNLAFLDRQIRKIRAPIKIKSALPPPPQKTQNTPPLLKRGILWTWFFLQKERIFQASVKLTHPFPAPELRTKILRKRGFFLKKTRETLKKTRVSLFADTLKSLEKKGKPRPKKARKLGKQKSKEIEKSKDWRVRGFSLRWHVCRTKLAQKIFIEARNFLTKNAPIFPRNF